jgi:MFS family permease
MKRIEAIFLLLAALFLFQAAHAAISVAVPLGMLGAGAGAFSVGLVAAAYSVGFLIGALYGPRFIARIGHIRAFAALAAIVTLATLAFSATDWLVVWVLVRALAGAAMAGMFTISESWLAETAQREERGRVMAYGLITGKLGLILGPFLTGMAEPGAIAAFAICAALFIASLIPITITRLPEPSRLESHIVGPRLLFHTAPAAAMTAIAGGMANASVFHLGPVYVAGFNPENSTISAAQFAAATILGGVISQFPAGVLSDRRDRREVMMVLSAIGAAASFVLALLTLFSGLGPVMLVALILGAGSGAIYGVSVAHAIDRAGPHSATVIMAAVLFTWALGGALGPLLAGVLMTIGLGGAGLFLFNAVVLSVLTFLLIRRRVVAPSPKRNEKSAFSPAQATSVAASELDPRADPEIDTSIDLEEPDANADSHHRLGRTDRRADYRRQASRRKRRRQALRARARRV